MFKGWVNKVRVYKVRMYKGRVFKGRVNLGLDMKLEIGSN